MNSIMSPAGSRQGMSGDQAALAVLPEDSAMKALIEHLMGSHAKPGTSTHHLILLSRNVAALCMDLLDHAGNVILARSVSDAVIAK